MSFEVKDKEICSYSGRDIYPGHGMHYARLDSKSFVFQSPKAHSHFVHRWNPRRIAWTLDYRKAHKKEGQASQQGRRRRIKRNVVRGVAGLSAAQFKAKTQEFTKMNKAQAAKFAEASKRRVKTEKVHHK
ncbi:Ribosomal protein L24e-related like protein [Aduncisulcus paluster]|uniref:Ribosomal protein L24e-related like protein n=1 Tax=Aduncisulcus paluster TaxID=2918883 RepID=A0ABQ5K413_9EUKA|nr:Ribosomal protein L24e-related like protein [Aduncisulcus paluster]|eukprot:gnl/Carplike_NY0171/221_a321_5974.p2 GENE.gnl/Carplike_NY0171/221_a321_5974~~gnl/Carplike_NY0171/221_a321_5974.p2  ORF type:complete len:130 (+),score=40.38 gnl/Carplike_NY0171/221_a321_5974:37-426(+)